MVIFTDASSKAYGAAAYVVSKNFSQLLTSKARVCPLKGRTLPQLEITGIQVGALLAEYVSNAMTDIQFSRIFIFSDSEVSLQWIRNDNSNIAYVKNRVDKIKELATKYKIIFYHVPTKDNPADILSRGVTLEQYLKKWEMFWLHGPTWLTNQNAWPIQRSHVVVSEILTDVPDPLPTFTPIFDPKKFSSFQKLVNVTRAVFRVAEIFVSRLRRESQFDLPEVYWLKFAQISEYPVVYDILKREINNVSELQKPSHELIKDLGLYLDTSTSLIKSRNRLRHAENNSETTILLPPKSHIANLIVLKAHVVVGHGGMSETLSEVRKQFWLPKG